jgi:glutamate racemase
MSRVGIFDSGVGGLSVWREIAARYPALETVYVADQAHIPYGPRGLEEIRDFSRGITRFLLDLGCSAVVLACNTASAASLAALRAEFPALPFVGMEPAVKPAAATSRSRVAGVLATPATFQGALFATTVERFAAGVRLVRQVCPGLVERIEAGELDGDGTEALLRECLAPSLAAGADTIVLACTHYPFARHAIERLAGDGVAVIDPAPAIARQVARVAGHAAAPAHHAEPVFFTTGDIGSFERVASLLLARPVRARHARWRDGTLHADATPIPTAEV